VEIGDFARFTKAVRLATFIGLVPGGDSSGGKQSRGSVAKAGIPMREAFGGIGAKLRKRRDGPRISGVEAPSKRQRGRCGRLCGQGERAAEKETL
jgi:transposase